MRPDVGWVAKEVYCLRHCELRTREDAFLVADPERPSRATERRLKLRQCCKEASQASQHRGGEGRTLTLKNHHLRWQCARRALMPWDQRRGEQRNLPHKIMPRRERFLQARSKKLAGQRSRSRYVDIGHTFMEARSEKSLSLVSEHSQNLPIFCRSLLRFSRFQVTSGHIAPFFSI